MGGHTADLLRTHQVDAAYIEVRARVRYWEDATVNGVDDDGSRIPFRDGDAWCPVIRLADGVVMDWPQGMTAQIHYKVCDQGEYWLLDANRKQVAKWHGDYVPDDYLCHGDDGYGDYIIFSVGAEGAIVGWEAPRSEPGDWIPSTARGAGESEE
jgi:hypothetical protein